ncbi:hypothetical protein [Bacillus alkalicellulosilyticus]|uniref:hypothetical protein n=1 Tax=Alkalihalobacterium alkalicellulosilyticum TaxID=1912214 RepID=UPI000997DCA3|nr:hypothetical protein [Bacillus alkalicellulosilyticus]
MFLNLLNKNESQNFLELSHEAMMINGVVKESEEAVYATFQKETGLLEYELQGKSLDSIVTAFRASTKKVRKAVVIEIAGILGADEEIDENEKNWILKLGTDLGLRESEVKKMVRWVQDFNDLLAEGYEYIHKK